MTDVLRALSSAWFWVPAILGAALWVLVGVVTWRYGFLAGAVAGLAGCGLMALTAGVTLVGLFLFDAHEPMCVYAGCRRHAPLQLRGKPYARPFCAEHAHLSYPPIPGPLPPPPPPPRGIDTFTLDELPGVVDASGTRSGPR